MKNIVHLLISALLILGISACDSGLTCDDASTSITKATNDYTDAINSGGDGATECQALKEALEALINDAECPQETQSMTQNLLDALDCD